MRDQNSTEIRGSVERWGFQLFCNWIGGEIDYDPLADELVEQDAFDPPKSARVDDR